MLFLKPASQTMKVKLFTTYCLLIVIVLVILGVAAYQTNSVVIEKTVGNSRLEVLGQIAEKLNQSLNEIQSISSMYFLDDELYQLMISTETPGGYEKALMVEKLNNQFSLFSYTFSSLKQYMVLYGFNGYNYSPIHNYPFEGLNKQPWFKEVMDLKGKPLWIRTHHEIDAEDQNLQVFTLARVFAHRINHIPLGMLMIHVDERILASAYEPIMNSFGSHIYLIDSEGNVVSDHAPSQLGANVADRRYIRDILQHRQAGKLVSETKNQKILVTYKPLDKANWILIEEVPVATLLQPAKEFYSLFIVALLFCISLGFIFSYVIARKLTTPIKELCKSMLIVETGKFQAVPLESSTDEIGKLSRGFNRMLNTINELMQNIKQEEQKKRKAEISFLQAQIQPHFLYNTLNSIRCMIDMEQNQSASDMMVSLMRLLHKTLGNGEEFNRISEECQILRDFIAIQSYRYPDKFEVAFDISPEIESYKIPKLLLQPLVENAILHGLAPKPVKGKITITGYRKEQSIQFMICDNGVGMTSEQLERIRKPSDSEHSRAFTRIGINNVHERITMNFGASFGVNIRSFAGTGTCLEVNLPIVL